MTGLERVHLSPEAASALKEAADQAASALLWARSSTGCDPSICGVEGCSTRQGKVISEAWEAEGLA